ncbi:MAG: phosphodiester glycosidase family protein [Pseudomonadota bacterium]
MLRPSQIVFLSILLVSVGCTSEGECEKGGCEGLSTDIDRGTGAGDLSDARPTGLDAIDLDTAVDAVKDAPRMEDSLDADAWTPGSDLVDSLTDLPPDATLPPDTATPDTTPIPQDGTPEHPFLVMSFPSLHDGDTAAAGTSDIDLYSCLDWVGEEGPEEYYRVLLTGTGDLKAEVAEAPGVDVDVHLLTSLSTSGGTAMDCIARANTRLVVEDLGPGEYWLVIDSYSEGDEVFSGTYKLAVEFDLWDQWQVVQAAEGVVWKKKLYSDYAGGVQTINVLEVDLSDPAVEVRPYWGDGCLHPSEIGEQEGAVAAINTGFFAAGCAALDLIKINGQVLVYAHIDDDPRRGFGVTADGAPIFASIPAWTDWPEAWHGITGHPNLVTDGEVDIWPWADSGFFTSRHPRTALGLREDGVVLLVTVDGRTAAGEGMTEPELAQHMIWLGAMQAINLDGGGSTTMWVDGMSVNGIVSHPSDNELADHHGERWVSDGLLVFSH